MNSLIDYTRWGTKTYNGLKIRRFVLPSLQDYATFRRFNGPQPYEHDDPTVHQLIAFITGPNFKSYGEIGDKFGYKCKGAVSVVYRAIQLGYNIEKRRIGQYMHVRYLTTLVRSPIEYEEAQTRQTEQTSRIEMLSQDDESESGGTT